MDIFLMYGLILVLHQVFYRNIFHNDFWKSTRPYRIIIQVHCHTVTMLLRVGTRTALALSMIHCHNLVLIPDLYQSLLGPRRLQSMFRFEHFLASQTL